MDPGVTTAPYDVGRLRRDFPVLGREVNGRPLVYLDNAATVQKPRTVIERVRRWYEAENANVHRGVHSLSAEGTDAFEEARRRIQAFMGAEHAHEVVFTSGATAAVNLVAYSFGQAFVSEGDEIVVSGAEHHANLVPWQQLCERTGATIRILPVTDTGDLAVGELAGLLTDRTRLVAVGHTSNALGTVHPLAEIIAVAHEGGVPVLVDGAQAAPHAPVDVTALDADFFCWSGHKAYGPMGFGVLYGKERWLEAMPPFLAGGDMIEEVGYERSTFNELPFKFEAGTPNVPGALGMAAAIDYLEEIGMDAVAAHEADVLDYAVERLEALDGVAVVGRPRRRSGAVSFVVEGVHPYDVGTVLDRMGIAVRTGHHCAQPLVRRMGHDATVRASVALYSTREEIDALAEGVEKARAFFG